VLFSVVAVASADALTYRDCLTTSSLSLRELRRLHETAWKLGSNVSATQQSDFETSLLTYNTILTSLCTGTDRHEAYVERVVENNYEYEIDWDSEMSEVLYDFSHFVLLNPSLFLLHSKLQWPAFLLSTYPSVNDYVTGTLELQEGNYFTSVSSVLETFVDGDGRNAVSHLVPIISWNTLGHAAEMGNPNAQHVLATAYSTGIYAGYLVPMDATRALILEHMAALSGHVLAHMALGYRYMHGIVVDESCERALPHYEVAANHANEQMMGKRYTTFIEKMKLSEVDYNYYSGSKSSEVTSEVLDYYTHLASEGDLSSAIQLANLYRKGSRMIDPNETLALVSGLIYQWQLS
jgi:hypothetical protein